MNFVAKTEIWFRFFLANQLGKTLAELDEMTAGELQYWRMWWDREWKERSK